MIRNIQATALSVALAAAALAGASQASAGQGDEPARVASASAPAGKTVTKRVKPGHKPIASRAKGKLRLVFHGKRGQRVNLALLESETGRPCAARFVMRKGKRVKRFAEGYWRLPRTGKYVAVYRWCTEPYSTSNWGEVQLRRAAIKRVPVDGTTVTMGRKAKVSYLAAVRVTGPTLVQRGHVRDYADRVVLPNRHSTDYVQASGSLFLAPGSPPRTSPSDVGDEASTQGRHLIPVSARSRVIASRAVTHNATLDGPATALTPSATHPTQNLITFTGEAGQWVHTQSSGTLPSDGWSTHDQIVAPDGTLVTSEVSLACRYAESFCPFDRAAWQLPETGTYQFSRVVTTPGESVGLRLAAQAPPMAPGGTTYTSNKPGQWVIGTLPRTASAAPGPTLRASNVSPGLAQFRATAVPGLAPRCPVYDTSLGCGDYSMLTVHHDALEATGWWMGYGTSPFLILQVPADAQGSVDLFWP